MCTSACWSSSAPQSEQIWRNGKKELVSSCQALRLALVNQPLSLQSWLHGLKRRPPLKQMIFIFNTTAEHCNKTTFKWHKDVRFQIKNCRKNTHTQGFPVSSFSCVFVFQVSINSMLFAIIGLCCAFMSGDRNAFLLLELAVNAGGLRCLSERKILDTNVPNFRARVTCGIYERDEGKLQF